MNHRSDAKGMKRPRFGRGRLWLSGFASLSGLLLAALFAFNAYYDPYLIFARSDTILHDPARGALTGNSYVTKIVQIIREKPDTILLGSSIVDNGFAVPGSWPRYYSPNPEAIARTREKTSFHSPIYDAGMDGKSIYEAYECLQHAYANNHHLKEVYLGIDWVMGLNGKLEDLQASVGIMNSTYVPPDFLLKYNLSLRIAGQSYMLWAASHPEWAARFSALSTLFDFSKPRGNVSVSPTLPTFPVSEAQAQVDEKLFAGPADNDPRLLVFSAWWLARLTPAVRRLANDMPQPQFLEYLQNIVYFCHDKNIRLKVFVTPRHPFFQVYTEYFGAWHYFEEWLSAVVKITPVWDFSGVIDFGPSPDKYYKSDSLHFIPTAGEIILPQLLQDTPSVAGVAVITQNNIQEMLALYRQRLTLWQRDHPNVDNSIHAVSTDFIQSQNPNAMNTFAPLMPALYRPDYNDHRLYKCLGMYIAVPVAQTKNLLMTDVLQFKQHGWPAAESLDKLILLLDNGKS